MTGQPGKKRVPLIIGIVVAITGVLVILAIAIATATFFFIRYRQAGSLHADTSQSQVIISQPGNMAQFPAGVPIQVEVDATGQQPFTSTELWINGVLEGVQAGPPAGLTSLTSLYSWIPLEGGNFSLVARAINQKNDIATSSAVIVFVNPPEYGDQPDPEAGKVYPAVLPASPAGQTSPPPPTPGDVPEPAVEWQGSPGDWLTDLTTSSAPAAPELVVAADGCNIQLDIHDLSENEEGFALYRQTTDSPDWVHAVDLASQPGKGWIETQESNLAGGITYYVAAFNSQGYTSSNLALVNIDPQACPPPQPLIEIPSLHLKVKNLIFDGQISHMYCYISLGSNNWSRWPETGFVADGASEQDAPLLVTPLILASLDDTGVKPGPQSLDLKLDCWGWQGGQLLSLGSLKETIDLVNPKSLHAMFSGAAFDISPNILVGLKQNLFPLEGSSPPFDIEDLGYVPESDQMPLIVAAITDLPNKCKAFMQDTFDKEVYCFPMPGYNAGPGGSNPQLYLIWDVYGDSCKGFAEGKECLPLSWWEGFAEKYPDPQNPALLWYLDYDVIGWPIPFNQQASRILPDFPPAGESLCSLGNQHIQVYLDVHTSLGEIRSAPSNLVTVPCPVPLGDTVDIEVNFNPMTLDNIDDGAGNYHIDDVWGHLAAWPGGNQTGTYLKIGWWGGEEPTDYGGANGYIYELGNGTYNLADFYLCTETVGASLPCEMRANYSLPYEVNNNKLVVHLKDGDSLLLDVSLWDFDNASNPDPCCNQYVWVGPRTIEQWAATVNEPYYLIQPEGDATCTLEVILNALKPGP